MPARAASFKATVVEPGVINARWEHRGHSFDVIIPYTNSTYSIRYKDSVRMDFNPDKRRIDDAYNEYVAGLAEHIEAGPGRRAEPVQEVCRRSGSVARINPRYAAEWGQTPFPELGLTPCSSIPRASAPRIHRHVVVGQGHLHAPQVSRA